MSAFFAACAAWAFTMSLILLVNGMLPEPLPPSRWSTDHAWAFWLGAFALACAAGAAAAWWVARP